MAELLSSAPTFLVADIDATARATVPLARVGEPDDYAEVIAYLCAGGGYITGEVIAVSGGKRL